MADIDTSPYVEPAMINFSRRISALERDVREMLNDIDYIKGFLGIE